MGRLFELKCWLRKAYRQGPRFRQYLGMLERSYYARPEELHAYQAEALQRMVHHCHKNVPYYTDLFRKLHLEPEDIRTPADLARLPFLDKQTVKANFDKLIAKNRRNFLCHTAMTSGSTGTPGKFIRDFNAINFENAAVWRHWRNAGDDGKRRITVRGDIVTPASRNEPPFWKFDPSRNELLMSGYHLSLENSAAYIEKILDFKPAVLYCYPSTGYLLAKFFRNHHVEYRLDAIFTSSESLNPEVRQFIEEVFGGRVYDWYGQAERVAAVSQCEAGRYHILEDYSVVETPQALDTEEGQELVGTHLHNGVMPLLRYRTFDYVTMGRATCTCGSSFRVVERIVGRSYNYLLTPEGYRISITNHIPWGVDNLIETQFYQEKPGEVVLNIITNGRFTERDRDRLVRNTLQHTSPRMKVIVNEVSDIPRGPNGKFVSIVNKIEALN